MICPICRSLMITEAAAAKNEILWHHCPRCELDLIRKHGRTAWPRNLKAYLKTAQSGLSTNFPGRPRPR
ncbi:MAG: hypothetical protein A2W25_11385 [candidate division Zixibacteria bacterium RBG_16_53_22]|nr:MAG: hypothetical protein A2W25_11385 [candidate division Zixibacteria bacterium RBG_16_53_22]